MEKEILNIGSLNISLLQPEENGVAGVPVRTMEVQAGGEGTGGESEGF